MALNIQRGRDHGIQGYVNYLKICSGNKDKHSMTFDDLILRQYLTQEVITLLISFSDDATAFCVNICNLCEREYFFSMWIFLLFWV